MCAQKPLLCYFGHHRCSSTWISEIIRQFAAETGRRFKYLEHPSKFSYNLKQFVEMGGIEVLAYSNASYKYVSTLDNFCGFHVIRDPRDVIVSSYFSHLYSHPTDGWPELAEHRQALQKTSKEEGICLEMEFSSFVLEDMRTWNYSQPNVLEVRMEELIQAPYTKFIQIFEFLNIIDHDNTIIQRVVYEIVALMNRMYYSNKYCAFMPLRIPQDCMDARHLLSLLYEKRFYRLSKGRIQGQHDARSHYRLGLARDWINHFSPQNIKLFKKMYNGVLLQLEYENDEDW